MENNMAMPMKQLLLQENPFAFDQEPKNALVYKKCDDTPSAYYHSLREKMGLPDPADPETPAPDRSVRQSILHLFSMAAARFSQKSDKGVFLPGPSGRAIFDDILAAIQSPNMILTKVDHGTLRSDMPEDIMRPYNHARYYTNPDDQVRIVIASHRAMTGVDTQYPEADAVSVTDFNSNQELIMTRDRRGVSCSENQLDYFTIRKRQSRLRLDHIYSEIIGPGDRFVPPYFPLPSLDAVSPRPA